MPSASTSTFIRPSVSMYVLVPHSMKVRLSIAALPIGTISSSRPRARDEAADMLGEGGGEKPSSRRARAMARPINRIVRIEPGLSYLRIGDLVAPASPTPVPAISGRHVLGQAERLADLADGAARGDR